MTHEQQPHPMQRRYPDMPQGSITLQGWTPNRSPSEALIDVLRAANVSVIDSEQARRHPVAVRVVRAGAPLFVEGSKASAVYWVRSGMFRTMMTAEDGYEQVLGFSGPGDALGLDTLSDGQHPTAAVALEDSCVWALPLRDFSPQASLAPEFGELLRRAAARELVRRTELVHIIAAVAAEVRLARFLLMWSQRRTEDGLPPRVFTLSMCRRDIASLLGMAHETVSRTFSLLTDLGYVSVRNRAVELLDLDGLRIFAQRTRRPCDLHPVRSAPQPAGKPHARAPLAAH